MQSCNIYNCFQNKSNPASKAAMQRIVSNNIVLIDTLYDQATMHHELLMLFLQKYYDMMVEKVDHGQMMLLFIFYY